jgi:hypothetical protein
MIIEPNSGLGVLWTAKSRRRGSTSLAFLAVKSKDDMSYPVVARRSPLVAAPELANDIVY